MNQDFDRLDHILDAITKVERYTATGKETFIGETMVHDAVLRQLGIIGEAVKHLSEDLKSRHPHVPWREIAGARDVYVHGYFGLHLERVWYTATQDLRSLKETVIGELEGERGGD